MNRAWVRGRSREYDWPHAIVNTTRDGRLMLTRTDPDGVPVGSTMAHPGQLIVPASDVECDPIRPQDQDRADSMHRGLENYLDAGCADAAREHLRQLEADPNLRHTAARWRAHDAVYPDSGACEMVARCLAADVHTLARFRTSLAEAREKLDASDPAITYLAWLVDELSGATT